MSGAANLGLNSDYINFYIGKKRAVNEDLKQANKFLSQINKDSFYWPDAATELGRIKVAEGKYSDAREFFTSALQRNPHQFQALFELARLDILTGDYAAAKEKLSRLNQYPQYSEKVFPILQRLDYKTR